MTVLLLFASTCCFVTTVDNLMTRHHLKRMLARSMERERNLIGEYESLSITTEDE